MAFTIPRVSVGTAGRLGKISRLGWLVIAGSVVLLLGYNSCTTYVRPGEAGVKQSKFGKGIEPTIYGVGLHYVGVGETMHRFPTNLQVLELTNSRSETAGEDVEGHRQTTAINIQTRSAPSTRPKSAKAPRAIRSPPRHRP